MKGSYPPLPAAVLPFLYKAPVRGKGNSARRSGESRRPGGRRGQERSDARGDGAPGKVNSKPAFAGRPVPPSSRLPPSRRVSIGLT